MKHIVKSLILLLICASLQQVESRIQCCFYCGESLVTLGCFKVRMGGYNDSIARGASDQSGVRSTDVDVRARVLSRFEYTTAEYRGSSRKNLSCSNATLELWNVCLLFYTHPSRLLLLPCFQPSSALQVCAGTPKLSGLPTESQQTISTNITAKRSHENAIRSKLVQHEFVQHRSKQAVLNCTIASTHVTVSDQSEGALLPSRLRCAVNVKAWLKSR